MSMNVSIYEALCCVLTCLDEPDHRILLEDKREVMLGRKHTVCPTDGDVPQMQFLVKANLTKQCVYVQLVEGRGVLNEEAMDEDETYTLTNGDVLGFTPDSFHQYVLSVPEIL